MRPGLYAFAAGASLLGATTYIGLVEQPARLALSGAAMLRQWKWSNRRGTLVLSVFCRGLGHSRLHSVQDQWRRALAHRRHHHPGELAIRLFRNHVGERLAVRDSAGNSRLTPAQIDAGLGLLEWGHVLIGVAAACVFAWALELPL
jgi:hypothetical protein